MAAFAVIGDDNDSSIHQPGEKDFDSNQKTASNIKIKSPKYYSSDQIQIIELHGKPSVYIKKYSHHHHHLHLILARRITILYQTTAKCISSQPSNKKTLITSSNFKYDINGRHLKSVPRYRFHQKSIQKQSIARTIRKHQQP